MPVAERNLLNDYFPRITPDFLTPINSKLANLRYNLRNTREWWNLHNRTSENEKTIKLGFSKWETAIPLVHTLLHDCDSAIPQKFESFNEASVIGTSLHEAYLLNDLIGSKKVSEADVINYFIALKPKLVLPYIKALQENYGGNVVGAWQFLQQSIFVEDLIQIDYEWFGHEMPEKPKEDYPPDIAKQITTRRGLKAYQSATSLLNLLSHDPDKKAITTYGEFGVVFNFGRTSSEHTRMQIPVRFDRIATYKTGDETYAVEFSDLKTGRLKMGHAEKFQALLMDFLAGHFVDNFVRGGYCSKKDGGDSIFMTYSIENLIPEARNYSLAYRHFIPEGRKQEASIEYIPVDVMFRDCFGELTDYGKVFLDWLEFYAEAFVVFKQEINRQLKQGWHSNLVDQIEDERSFQVALF